jgi:hypothetical protein
MLVAIMAIELGGARFILALLGFGFDRWIVVYWFSELDLFFLGLKRMLGIRFLVHSRCRL